jgi:hypothetical protein
MSARKKISKSLRFKIFHRDEFARLLESYHVTEIAEAMKIAGRRHARQYIGYQDQIVSYIWGILRSRERERGE